MEETIEHQEDLFINSPFNKHIGIEVKHFLEGDVVLQLTIKDSHLNVNDTAHGGVYFSLLDSVMGATVRSTVKNPITTISMNINYFSPIKEQDIITATAKIIQKGNSIVTAEGEVSDKSGKVVSKAIGTFKIMRHLKKGAIENNEE